jgi:hypothetical protein
MPILDIDITPGKREGATGEVQRLRIELYHPLSGEVFEAKYDKGRIEVDKDGSITFFTTNLDHVNVSLFLGRNLSVSLNRRGEVTIKTTSKVISVEQDLKSRGPTLESGPASDSIFLRLE